MHTLNSMRPTRRKAVSCLPNLFNWQLGHKLVPGGGPIRRSPTSRAAARLELVAFDVVEPNITSRTGISPAAQTLSREPDFRAWCEDLFRRQRHELTFMGVGDLARELRALQARVASLEAELAQERRTKYGPTG